MFEVAGRTKSEERSFKIGLHNEPFVCNYFYEKKDVHKKVASR